MRIDDDIALGISRASREQKASLVVMGWGRRSRLPIRLFSNLIDSVLWASHCPVAVSRLLDSPINLRRILVPIENLTQQSIAVLKFAQILASENQGRLTLLHVCDRTTSASKIAWIQSQMSLLADKITPTCDPQIQIVPDDEVVRAIVNASKTHDLVILRSSRRHTSAGGLAISDITTQAAQEIQCSVVMLGEPHHPPIAVLLNR
jgi:nucleotide-binding universal stress UspA family protein